MGANNQMPCDFCGAPYDPVSTRWLCPNCHMKTNCCDGAPCEIVKIKDWTNTQLLAILLKFFHLMVHLFKLV